MGSESPDEDAIRQYMGISSFGQTKEEFDPTAQIEGARRQVASPAEKKDTDSDNDSDDSDDDSDDDDDDDEFPITHQVVFKTHERAVTAITVDPAGARMVTGSSDCTLKIHDFASLAPNTIRAFRSVDPTATKGSSNVETHPVNQVIFNPLAPSQMLVVTGLPQAKIFDRDGDMITEFVKGDMYLRDMHQTKGHISEVTTGTWHPTNKDLCVTAGTDSTLRIWDVNNRRAQKEVIVHKSRTAGSAGRTRMTAVAWAAPADGGPNILVAAALDGSLVMWTGEGPYSRPAAEIRDAHKPDTWTSGIDISPDGRLVVTRGGDNTIKLWDTRRFKSPIATVAHPSTSAQYPTTNIRFSPSGSNIITGSADGTLHIFSPALRPVYTTPITPGVPLITVHWHPKLNQILTGSANGTTHLLFSPKLSTAHTGALLILSKPPKKHHLDDDATLTTSAGTQGISGDSLIILPGGQPASAAGTSTGKKANVGLTHSGRSRDPRRPKVPATTPFAKGNPDARHVREFIPLSSMRDEDPREALLKYAEVAEKEPIFTNAWRETQPQTIYGELSDEEGGEEDGPEKKKVRR